VDVHRHLLPPCPQSAGRGCAGSVVVETVAKSRIVFAFAVLAAVGIFLADVYLTPGAVLPVVLYAVPILVVAYFLPPRRVIAVAIITLGLESLAALLDQAPLWRWVTDALALAVVGYLGVELASRIAREATLAEERAHLTEQVQAERERLETVLQQMPEG
jgi:hypothetical protein